MTTIQFTAEEIEGLKNSLNAASVHFHETANHHGTPDILREVRLRFSKEASDLWFKVYSASKGTA